VEIGSSISIIKDPFNSESMTVFSVNCYKGAFIDKSWRYKGRVEFENGDTKGEQHFEADSLQNLLIKMEAFVKELK